MGRPESRSQTPPILDPERREDWETWLERNYASSEGVWLRFAKKGSSEKSVSYEEAVEVALCHGWIDGQLKALDEKFYLRRFTPRASRSKWSRINKEKAGALIAAGKMRSSGYEAIEAAKAEGLWDEAYDSASRAAVPEDFQAALDVRPRASAFFAGLDKANRYAVLYRIQTAGKGDKRARKIEQLVSMLERREKIHP